MSAIPNPYLNAVIPNVSQSVAIGASSVASAAFQPGTSVIQVTPTVACFVKTGAAPTATTSGMYLAAGVPVLIGVTGGQKIAVIESASTGTLYITEAA